MINPVWYIQLYRYPEPLQYTSEEIRLAFDIFRFTAFTLAIRDRLVSVAEDETPAVTHRESKPN